MRAVASFTIDVKRYFSSSTVPLRPELAFLSDLRFDFLQERTTNISNQTTAPSCPI